MKRRNVVILFVLVIAGLSATVAFSFLAWGGTTETRPLPVGCVKPSSGYLVLASEAGFNDSISHGAPADNWPILNVSQGQTVTIVVCNSDMQATGFQITHYDDSSNGHPDLTLTPGQVVTVSFTASQTGRFYIYCEIFCSIHIYMQSGLLNVTPS